MNIIAQKMIRPKFFLTAIGATICSVCHAQIDAQIFFKDATNHPLENCIVKILTTDQKDSISTFTDENGLLQIPIKSYPMQLVVEAMGYQPEAFTLKNYTHDTLTFFLKQEASSLDEIIVTGVGRPTKVDEAVANYRILSDEAMRNQGAVTLNDALRNQIGLNIGNDQMLGSNISMRGLSGNNVKILIDGLPVNGRENGNIDLSQINLYNIARAEVVQGPMSIMYGSDALGGVINLITKKNTKKFSSGATMFYESIGKYNVALNNAMSYGKSSYTLDIARNYFQGWDTATALPRDPLWRPKEQYLANFKYTFQLKEDAAISYALDFLDEKLTVKGTTDDYTYYNRNTRDQIFKTNRYINRIIANWRTGSNGYWQTNNSFANYNRRQNTYITDLSTMNQVPSQLEGDNVQVVFNDFTSRTTFNNKAWKLNYTFGYDINYQMSSGGSKMSEGNKHIGDFALFLTTDYFVLPKLTLQPALRYSYNTTYKAPLSPSFSFLFKPTKECSMRGTYARGFRAPSLKEMYLDFRDFNHFIVGNNGLKAEYGHHFQLSTAYEVSKADKLKGIVTLTGFYDDVQNQISLTTVDTMLNPVKYMYINIGRTRFFAAQLRVEYKIYDLDWNAGLSYNKSIYTESHSEAGLTLITPAFDYFDFNTNLTYTYPKWHAGFSVYYKFTGSQPTLGSDITGNAIFGAPTKEYHNLDASINKSLWKQRILLTAGVRNVMNNVVVGLAQSNGHNANGGLSLTPGRSYFASLNLQIGK